MEAADLRVGSGSPCFGCLSPATATDARLGICTWSLRPRERGCARSSGSVTPAPRCLGAFPRTGVQQLCLCAVGESQDAARGGSSSSPLTARAVGPTNTPSPPSSLCWGCPPPGLCMLPGVANWLLGSQGCRGCSAT